MTAIYSGLYSKHSSEKLLQISNKELKLKPNTFEREADKKVFFDINENKKQLGAGRRMMVSANGCYRRYSFQRFFVKQFAMKLITFVSLWHCEFCVNLFRRKSGPVTK